MARSKSDQERLDVIHNMPCICCHIEGVRQPSPTEAHHLVDKGYRKHSGGHRATLPLCAWHHRAEDPIRLWGKERMSIFYGPSLKYQGKRGGFADHYGTERELLAKVNELIGQYK